MINPSKLQVLFLGLLLLTSTSSMSAQVSTTNNESAINKAAPLVIQSQVKGSQEQPKVIYIMPWQGVDKVIEVKGKQRTIKLPDFKPINPRDFREQVRAFANTSLAEKSTK